MAHAWFFWIQFTSPSSPLMATQRFLSGSACFSSPFIFCLHCLHAFSMSTLQIGQSVILCVNHQQF